MSISTKLLEIKDLIVEFRSVEGIVRAVNKVSLNVHEGEILGIVGESGAGKSVTALSIMGLIESPPGKIVSGEINFLGKNLLNCSEKEISLIRGNEISIIFQEPLTSLNPTHTCGSQVAESLMIHKGLAKKEALKKTIELFKLVGIPLPEKRVNEYPFQLSGGMRQRVMIVMALICKPKLLIADEPTTFLDVTIQAQIIELLKQLQKEIGMAIIMVTHDLALEFEICNRIIIMYAGQVYEEAPHEELFTNPLHPYTIGLLKSIPKITPEKIRLSAINGSVPNPTNLPDGCSFYSRCPRAMDVCKENKPKLFYVNSRHSVRCWLFKN